MVHLSQDKVILIFCIQLVCTLKGNNAYSLAEQIMNNLLGRQVDNNYVVRMYCIRGLGNMADIGENQVCLSMYEVQQ